MTRGPVNHREDAGFSLAEVLVSMSIVAMTMLISGAAFVRAQSVVRYEGDRQSAAEFAADLVGELLATPYSALVKRSTGATDPDAVAALAGVVNTSAAIASSTATRNASNVSYRATWYAVPCTSTNCTLTIAPAVAVPMLQLGVAVTWPAKECTTKPNSRCTLTTTSLLSPVSATDPGVVSLPTVTPSTTPAPTTPTPTPTPSPSPSPLPLPTPDLVWAATSLKVMASNVTINATIHSNQSIEIMASSVTISPRTEYGTTYSAIGVGLTVPSAVKVAATVPVTRPVVDYRPGGSRAVAAGAGYKQISCSAGSTWTYSAAAVGAATIVYVPCNVSYNGSGSTVKPLIVAEGTIKFSGSNVTIGDAVNPSTTGLISNSNASTAIEFIGSGTSVYGNLQAVNGGVSVKSANSHLRCGLIGNTVEIIGSGTQISAPSNCTS